MWVFVGGVFVLHEAANFSPAELAGVGAEHVGLPPPISSGMSVVYFCLPVGPRRTTKPAS